MKKKILKIAAFALAAALIVGVLWFANSLVGNPISKALAQNAAKKYLAENYANTDYVLGEVNYNFKDGYYYVQASSPTNVDGDFAILFNGFGKLQYDYYENNVSNGLNTARRIDMDYRKIAETLFNSGALSYDAYIAYGELEFVPAEYQDAPGIPSYALITDDLTPNAYYNANELGAQSGKLTVYIYDATVTAERLAEVLLDIRECFDEAGIGFRAIDCVLEYPREADGFYEDGRVEVMNFAYADIYAEGLVERVEASNRAADLYYDEQDAEKYVENE